MHGITKLELLITISKNKVMATCNSFPGCKGVADTESDAIAKLLRSITRKVTAITKSTLETILEGPALITEPITSIRKSKSQIRKVYAVDPSLFNMSKSKSTQIQYPNDDRTYTIPPERDVRRLMATIQTDFMGVRDSFIDDDESDDMVWLPISLN